MIITATCAGLAFGTLSCREKETVSTADTPKAATPATTPTSAPVLVALPAIILLDLGGPEKKEPIRCNFPPAKLVLIERQGMLHATLFSDDPKESLNPDHVGNSFYFDMELNVATRAELADALYTYTAPSNSDLGDSSDGIFLQGGAKLQPVRMKVQFQVESGQTVVWLSGAFNDLSAPETATPLPPIVAQARLLPTVISK